MSTPLARLRPDTGPVRGRWGLGFGDLAARLTRAPEPLDGVLRQLNHFGALVISDDAVEFDGDSVDWSDIKDIETHSLIGYLASGALDKQIGKLPLPWFPGRRLLLGLASDAALTALVALTGDAFRNVFEVRIPAEVNYKALLRHRTLSPGVLSTLLMADPAVRDALIQTAKAHGVTVRRADSDAVDDAEERLRRIKAVWDRVAEISENRSR
ncbi:hypothetical protein CRI77_14175 [Mycolicibacterium duvalii]|uniref:Uncharacterized protein n=1 Tax=Mycolicibacterium duvalii TaxID=39688 RepID=A0A7I7JVF3_9MYCO|nr:hypothetical protein [Mycolicibacterium duvalii]MCV7367082.1 hypothetical protein [Mycolicibacterium duvalii]PEG40377.1 hypothetical protein CRI77_14175 [Mycolicibacterium duvalii]BBX15790.1 hypothetical protein MDUV_06500 [Mycolicibacterium duvalii]